LLAFTLLLAAIQSSAAQTAPLNATSRTSPPPSELAQTVAQQLSSDGVRVSLAQSGTTIDFWWVKSLAAKGGSGPPSWAEVEEGTLVGAVMLSADYADIRGRVLKAGVYTLRYGIQPANGDHLGTSPFREFLLLSPAALDKDPAPQGHDGTVDLSTKAIGGSHPAVWSIDPPAATGAPLEHHRTELGHDAIVMQVPATGGILKFGVVLIGKIEA
jgi:hypothetical protein